MFPQRDAHGEHRNDYHGAFIPQIPDQLIRRFTAPGDLVVDLFAGLGTTLIEARRLGRHAIGVELNPAVAREALARADREPGDTFLGMVEGDATSAATLQRIWNLTGPLEALFPKPDMTAYDAAALVLMHPPYHDIITFSDDPHDLSNQADPLAFLTALKPAFHHAWCLLKPKGVLGLVMGDIYYKGQVVPLAFQTLDLAIQETFLVKGIIVKDIHHTRGKGKDSNLWKYRCLKNGTFTFQHEYVFVLQKP
jgi:hypothetical protein